MPRTATPAVVTRRGRVLELDIKERARPGAILRIYKLHPEYDSKGDIKAAWVDDGTALMDLDIYRRAPMADEWPLDLTFPLGADSPLTDVLFNPDGLLFSADVREALSPIAGAVEWLPISVVGHGRYHMLHPLASVDLGLNSDVHRNRVSKNITAVRSYDFPQPNSLPACFMVNQPVDSAAGKVGFCMRGIYVREAVRAALEPFTGVGFSLVFEADQIS